MPEIETNEQAIQWCVIYAATVKFLDGVHVYVLGECVGDGATFVQAVDAAALELYAESRRSEALSDLEEEDSESD